MDSITKRLLVGAAICTVSVKATFFLIDTYVPLPGSEARAHDSRTHEQSLVTAYPRPEQLNAILQGKDPSDVLAPTAAGEPKNTSACRTGKIEMPKGSQPNLNGHRYVSMPLGQRSYILVLAFGSGYLVQKDYQVVTATEHKTIPDKARKRLEQALAHLESCKKMPLYLSSVTPLNAG